MVRSLFTIRRGSVLASVVLGSVLLATPGFAQIELGSALRSLERHGTSSLPRALLGAKGARVAVLAEYPADSGVSEWLVDGRYRPLWLAGDELALFAHDHPGVKLHWAPPRHVLLDEAEKWI